MTIRRKRFVRWAEVDKNGLVLEQLLAMFNIYNKSEAKSEKTLHWYQQNIESFIRWLEETGRSQALGDMSELLICEHVLEYQKGFYGKPMAPSTVNNRVRALRAFFN